MINRRELLLRACALTVAPGLLMSSPPAAALSGDWIDVQRLGERLLINIQRPLGIDVARWLLRDVRAGDIEATPHPRLLSGLAMIQAELRQQGHYPVFDLTSGLRTAATQAEIPHAAARSRHLPDALGRVQAVDFVPIGVSRRAVVAVIERLDFGGLGVYPSHLHFDCRTRKARW